MLRTSRLLELVEAYCRSRLGLSAGYIDQLKVSARVFQRWAKRPVLVEDLGDGLIVQFLSDWGQSVSPVTANDKRRMLVRLRGFAVEHGLIGPDVPAIPAYKEPRRLPEAWTVSEVESLLAAARRQSGSIAGLPARGFWPALILTVYDTAERIGAIRQARSSDFSAAERYLIVRAEYQKTDIDRLFPLSDQTVAAIAAIYCPHREQLFPWPYRRQTLFVRFRKMVEAAGLKASKRGMSLFHKLRRTNLSYCAAADLELARSQADHHSAALTKARYIDPRIARSRSAVDVLPRPLLTGEPPRAVGAWVLD